MMAPEPAVLPDDALVEVLRRLAPHSLATSRLVCSAWRDTIDTRLRGHLLSRSVRGIFINFTRLRFSEFFSRPTTGPTICEGLDFLPCTGVKVMDHCNGLLLCSGLRHECDKALPHDYVVNPATRRWTRLPQCPCPHMAGFDQSAYLAFEPGVSLHYEVFLIPRVLCAGVSDDNALLGSEWPPASYAIHVFSSATQWWDMTTFVRKGEAPEIIGYMDSDWWYNRYHYHAFYWQGNLYIHCQHGYLMRMCLSDHTYRVIKLPGVSQYLPRGYPEHHLGKSLRGVYCVLLSHKRSPLLQIWHLNESCSRIEWVLNPDTTLKTFEHEYYAQQLGRQWILQDVNYNKLFFERNGNIHEIHIEAVEEKYDWNSNEDNILDIEYDVEEGYEDNVLHVQDGYEDNGLDFEEDVDEHNILEEGYYGNYYFLGFHPYREIVFLISSGRKTRALTYDWNSSKFQDLGNVGSAYYDPICGLSCGETHAAFLYTPCWIGEFPGNEIESLYKDQELSRKKLELEEESNLTCMDIYEMRKFHGRAKRTKDSAAKIRRRQH
ncbi:F-box protein At5g07610-like [Triticum dicoccoides]|uniref:F-box protein At5g07610-like n=1 Tax=Triticum dicoccoides TaxID=85692 RepID=UPI001891BA4F|nr:F-box protein At5g07610-like [Triticum dicoccoides]